PPSLSSHHTSTSPIYTPSLHDALPIYFFGFRSRTEVFRDLFLHCYASESNAAERSICETSCLLTIFGRALESYFIQIKLQERTLDRKSTRLNSSHVKISYAVFCLKKIK